MRFRSLPVITLRRMAGNWRLLTSVALGTVVASAIVAATAIYSDAIRDLGLDFALEHHEPRAALDVHVRQNSVPVDAAGYQRTRSRVDSTIADALDDASSAHIRQLTTATFFPTSVGVPVSSDERRPRAFLRFRSDLESHVRVVEGVLPGAIPDAEGVAVPAAVGRLTAERAGMSLGSRFELHPFWDAEAKPLAIEVVALVEPVDLEDPYWGGDPEALDREPGNWQTYALFAPEATLFGAAARAFPGMNADIADDYRVNLERLDAREARATADTLEGASRLLEASEPRLRVETALVEVLRTFDTKLFFTRIPLLVFLVQVVGIVAYYLVMVSTMLVERQASEIALLRSRGATTAQLLAQYGVEAVLLAGLGTLVGPPLAAAAISVLGPTPAFDALSGGGFLDVRLSRTAYLLAAGGALVAFLSLMVPAWRVTRTTMVEFKRSAARPRQTPFFLRYYLDVAFFLVAGVVFWRFAREDQLFSASVFGDIESDPLLLLTPAVFLVTVGVLFLRLFPLVLRGFAWALQATRSTSVLVGIRSLVRDPSHYTRLVLLLMFATGVGMFGASFSRTLDRSYADRAAYVVGADVRASDFRGLARAGETSVRGAIEGFAGPDASAEVASPALRMPATLEGPGGTANIEVLGVQPSSFGEAAFFREDFSSGTFEEVIATLEGDAIRQPGIAVPGTPRQIGAWVKAPTISGLIDIGVRLRDAEGRHVDVVLGQVQPQQDVTTGWRFVGAVLPGTDRLTPPLELTAYFFVPRGSVAAARGTLLLGAVLASDAAPEAGVLPGVPRAEAFPDASVVHTFASVDGLQVVQGLRPTSNDDRPIADGDAPPGFNGSIRYSWVDSRRGGALRGLQPTVEVRPIQAYVLRTTAAELGIEVGDRFTTLVGSRYAAAELAGILEFFPTVRSDAGDGFALVHLDRLLFAVNQAPGQGGYAPNEGWFATEEPEALRAALEGSTLAPQILLDVASERVAQQEDPLVAAGWQGILAIAFGAVLLLSAIGFLVYSYLTAQERALEFAILRTLGFSRRQVFGVVAFEHLFVIAAGMGLGTLVGLQVGRQMMGLLATDETGAQVLPPFVLGVSWPAVLLAWGILGAVFAATIAAVVLLYVRLQVDRALRIGDV